LGKNLMREVCRKPAIEAYRFFIRYSALLALKERVQAAFREDQEPVLNPLLTTPSNQPQWEHARRILCEELDVTDVVAGLRELPAMFDKIARAVELSKTKDDQRGERIIDDYADVHLDTTQDPVVRQTWEETHRLQHEVEELVARLAWGRTTEGALSELQPVAEAAAAGVPNP
jgi:hypothetical protein